MTPAQIEKAADAVRYMKRTAETVDALKCLVVTGIQIGDVHLCDGSAGGTGTISSIGYPADLKAAMTKALHDWASKRLEAARQVAEASGVTLITSGTN